MRHKTETFPDKRAVVLAGMIEKGWVPAILPENAINIRFSGDLDSGRVEGSFDLPDADAFQTQCALAGGNLNRRDQKSFRCDDAGFVITVQRSSHTVRYHSATSEQHR